MRLRYYPKFNLDASPDDFMREEAFCKDYYIDDDLYDIVARYVKLETFREIQDAAKKAGGPVEAYVVEFVDYLKHKYIREQERKIKTDETGAFTHK